MIRAGFIILSFLFFTTTTFATENSSQIHSSKTKAFVDYMVNQYHFDRDQLTRELSHAKYNDEVIQKITHPYEQKPWNVYRAYFITEERVQNGLLYWEKHAQALKYTEQRYGIPSSLIVAIIGVETNYGQETGRYSALDALSTLAFYHKPREKFFTRELEQFFLLTHEQGLPPQQVKSSYAGALGIPQFMPSTYRHYATGYLKHSTSDLINNDNDAIVSIANYLKTNGWKRNQPVAGEVVRHGKIDPNWLSDKAIPNMDANQLKSKEIQPIVALAPTQKAALVALKSTDDPEYWVTFGNFRVIMSYNPRIIYAMTVYQLSQIIQKAHDDQTTRSSTKSTSARTVK